MKYGGTGGMDPDADPYDSAAAHADARDGQSPFDQPLPLSLAVRR